MIKNARLLYSRLAYLVGVILLIPNTAFAAVFISEVAWMGSLESANHEWIELTNDGAAVNVDGWVLSDTQNLRIDLVGTIPANSTVVLERSSEATAPGSAFLIYTGALVNTGTDLLLTNSAGQLVERVSGGENWQSIGGDNTTKETAQYSSQGWYTAKATPGQFTNTYQAPDEPEAEADNTSEKETSNSPNKSKSTNKTVTVPLTLPDITLQLQINAQEIGYVNQTIVFSGDSSGIGKHLEDSLVYQWNFGDGFTAVGKEPTHVFAYAGKYVVTLKAEYKRQVQITRHEITILPVKMSLTQNSKGDVQVHNNTQYEIDISGYRVKGSREFFFPDYSVVLPSQTVTIPRQYLKGSFDPLVALYDTAGVFLASSFVPVTAVASTYTVPQSTTIQKAASRQVVSRPQIVSTISTFSQSEPKGDILKETPPPPVVLTPAAPAPTMSAAAGELPRNERFAYVGLAILLLLGVLGVYLAPRQKQPE